MTSCEAWARERWGFGTETYTLKLRPPKVHILEKGDQKKTNVPICVGRYLQWVLEVGGWEKVFLPNDL